MWKYTLESKHHEQKNVNYVTLVNFMLISY